MRKIFCAIGLLGGLLLLGSCWDSDPEEVVLKQYLSPAGLIKVEVVDEMGIDPIEMRLGQEMMFESNCLEDESYWSAAPDGRIFIKKNTTDQTVLVRAIGPSGSKVDLFLSCKSNGQVLRTDGFVISIK